MNVDKMTLGWCWEGLPLNAECCQVGPCMWHTLLGCGHGLWCLESQAVPWLAPGLTVQKFTAHLCRSPGIASLLSLVQAPMQSCPRLRHPAGCPPGPACRTGCRGGRSCPCSLACPRRCAGHRAREPGATGAEGSSMVQLAHPSGLVGSSSGRGWPLSVMGCMRRSAISRQPGRPLPHRHSRPRLRAFGGHWNAPGAMPPSPFRGSSSEPGAGVLAATRTAPRRTGTTA